MIRTLVMLLWTLSALTPVRPVTAPCASQEEHQCACKVQMGITKCCCTGKSLPGKAQTEAPQVQHADPGLLPAAVVPDPAVAGVTCDRTPWVDRPVAAPATPLFLLTGSFLS